ncbi:lipocalin family protein [Pseudomonadales bacterium]|nr:lipocalin family protein [Pseudomonadales bacterium]
MNLLACSHNPTEPLATVAHVDLDRFMGDWFVVATIPTLFEKGLFNPVEHYARNADGSIKITFSYRRGSLTAPKQQITATGFIQNSVTNATWAMQPFWPIKAEYLVIYLQDDQFTIIGRSKRDYLWIMARDAHMAPQELAALVDRAVALGYPREKIQLPVQP